MLSQAYNIIIDRGLSAIGHKIKVVDGLNTTENVSFPVNVNCETVRF